MGTNGKIQVGLLLILFLSCVLIHCGGKQEVVLKQVDVIPIHGPYNDTFYIQEVGGCEYVVYHGSQKGGIVHHGKCKNHGL